MTKAFIVDITKKAGKEVRKRYGKVGVAYTKNDPTDVVTEADLAANKVIVNAIRKRFPAHGIISEETDNHQDGAEYVWVVDPLDGTRNFLTHTPLVAVLIALMHRDKVVLATMYNPITDELFFAQKGKGAFRNGKRIYGSATKEWRGSWGAVSTRLSPKSLDIFGHFLRYAKKEPFWASGLGSCGVSAMYVADGRRDWHVSRNGSLWDYAAPSLVLTEAGCKVSNLAGKPWTPGDKEMISSNRHLHGKLVRILSGKE